MALLIYGYDFNFIDDLKTYVHRTFAIVKIVFSYLDSETPDRLLSQRYGYPRSIDSDRQVRYRVELPKVKDL